jgi:hypothetical protein
VNQEKSALILFSLSPEAEGQRKKLGLGCPEKATAVFAAFRRHLERVCSDLPGIDFILSTPDRSSSNAHPIPQRGTSFGDSLRFAVEDAFSMGYERVVVIGNDAPEISRSYLQKAFQRLKDGGSQTAVISPARDGGYALLGLTDTCPRAFSSMPWGSRRVFRLTESRLKESGFRVARLPTLEDIDGPRSLVRFLLRARRSGLVHLARELAEVTKTFPNTSLSPKIYVEALLSGWLALRAPPAHLQ